MEKEKNSIKEWARGHKKAIILGTGCVIVGGVLVYLGVKNQENIVEYFAKNNIEHKPKLLMSVDINSEINKKETTVHCTTEQLTKIIEDKITHSPHFVEWHLRKLPEGYHASAEKIFEAAEKGIDLPEGYTWIKSYRTGDIAA